MCVCMGPAGRASLVLLFEDIDAFWGAVHVWSFWAKRFNQKVCMDPGTILRF